jgi:Fe2+ or Zn2+ uptake regulation protein
MGKTKREEKPTEKDLEGFLAVLKRLDKPATSREISDYIGIKNPENGRALVRRVMAKLTEEGKVKIVEAEKGRARLYSLV